MKDTTITHKLTSRKTKDRLEHEIAIVKAARLANAVGFALDTVRLTDQYPGSYKDRQRYHGMFLLGGYLYEAFKLTEYLGRKYKGEECFEELEYWLNTMQKDVEILAEMNFNVAFHMSWDDKQTRSAMSKTDMHLLELCEAAHQGNKTYYHRPAEIDTQMLCRSLRNRCIRNQLMKFFEERMPVQAQEFVDGARDFITGVSWDYMDDPHFGDDIRTPTGSLVSQHLQQERD